MLTQTAIMNAKEEQLANSHLPEFTDTHREARAQFDASRERHIAARAHDIGRAPVMTLEIDGAHIPMPEHLARALHTRWEKLNSIYPSWEPNFGQFILDILGSAAFDNPCLWRTEEEMG